jgi:hypothetical protein
VEITHPQPCRSCSDLLWARFTSTKVLITLLDPPRYSKCRCGHFTMCPQPSLFLRNRAFSSIRLKYVLRFINEVKSFLIYSSTRPHNVVLSLHDTFGGDHELPIPWVSVKTLKWPTVAVGDLSIQPISPAASWQRRSLDSFPSRHELLTTR